MRNNQKEFIIVKQPSISAAEREYAEHKLYLAIATTMKDAGLITPAELSEILQMKQKRDERALNNKG